MRASRSSIANAEFFRKGEKFAKKLIREPLAPTWQAGLSGLCLAWANPDGIITNQCVADEALKGEKFPVLVLTLREVY
jgi:hypothetical protein